MTEIFLTYRFAIPDRKKVNKFLKELNGGKK